MRTAWSSTNRGKWLTSFMLCAMTTCLMIMLCSDCFPLFLFRSYFLSLSFSLCCLHYSSPHLFQCAMSVIVFYWVLRCAYRARASLFLLFAASCSFYDSLYTSHSRREQTKKKHLQSTGNKTNSNLNRSFITIESTRSRKIFISTKFFDRFLRELTLPNNIFCFWMSLL